MTSDFPPHPRCGLPVLRLEYNEDRDEYDRVVEVCGEQLYLEEMSSGWVDNDGPTGDGDGPVWKLTCVSGHVLMVPDDQGNEQYSSMPFHWEEAKKALGGLLHNDGSACGNEDVPEPHQFDGIGDA